jgi:gluconolactonase
MKLLRCVIMVAIVSAGPSLWAQVLPPGATAQLLDTGFMFTEGPLYDGNGGVYFSDLGPSAQQATKPSHIWRYDIASDTSQIVDPISGGANGLIKDASGRVISADRERRQISRRSASDIKVVETVLVNKFNNVSFNGPNDLVMDATGGIFFTDPDNENRQSLPDALYYLNSAGGLSQLRTFTNASNRRPNGVVLSPDGTILYLSIESGKRIMAYDVGANGVLSNDRQFAITTVNAAGMTLPNITNGPDGLTVDAAGNVYAAVQNAVFAWNPAGARLFDLSVSQDPTNLKFGGANGRTLFITGGTSLFSVDLNVPVPAQGDYNGNGVVDAGDYVVWRNTLGTTANWSADGNGNRVIDTGDYDVWRSHFGQAIGSGSSVRSAVVPEPGLAVILCSACAAVMVTRWSARRSGAGGA